MILESSRAQAAGSGIAILPAPIRRLVGDSVRAIHLKERPEVVHRFASRTGVEEPPMKAFTTALKSPKPRG